MAQSPPPTPPRLELLQISKRYPSVVANDGVSLRVAPGEIHAILGENGAGKSTLMKIIYGVLKPDAGSVALDGKPLMLSNPQQARAAGISMVFQHFSLFETMTVAENVWLGLDQRMSLAEVRQLIHDKSSAYGFAIDADRPVHELSVGEMQRVEITRALLTNPRVLILDEPTSVLTPQAVEQLFGVLRQLSDQGCSILYISHKLHEIRALCTACTVLRSGKVSGSCDPRQESNASLSRLMIGAEPATLQHPPQPAGKTWLRVHQLNQASASLYGTALRDVNCEVRAGEIVGIAGVSGNGQAELLAALSGESRSASNAVLIAERPAGALSPGQRRALGMQFVPEERLGRGAVPGMSLAQNLLLTRNEAVGPLGWLRLGQLQTKAADIIARFGVKAPCPGALAQALSGGNLQKYILGRAIDAKPQLLVAAQPTWGVDVGAAARIHTEILQLREQGCAVLLVSEELDELFALCDRLHVIAKGELSPSLPRAAFSVERVGAWMSGLWRDDSASAESAAQARTKSAGLAPTSATSPSPAAH